MIFYFTRFSKGRISACILLFSCWPRLILTMHWYSRSLSHCSSPSTELSYVSRARFLRPRFQTEAKENDYWGKLAIYEYLLLLFLFNLILASLISKRFEVSLVLLISRFDLRLVSIETSPSPRSFRNSEQDARGRCPRKTWFSLVPVHALKQSPWLLIIHPAHCMWRMAFKVNIGHIFLSVILCNKVIIICYILHL